MSKQQKKIDNDNLAFRSDVFYRLYHNLDDMKDLCNTNGLLETEITDWRKMFIDKADELFAECKRKVLDSYIEWEKSKLLALNPLNSARMCVEQIVKARIIDVLKITEFSHLDLKRYKMYGAFQEDYRSLTFIALLDIVIYEKKLLTTDSVLEIDKIRLKANKFIHEETDFFYFEIHEYHEKLTKIVNEFFIIYDLPKWKEEFVDPQKDAIYYNISAGIATQNRKIEESEILEKVEEAKNKYFKYLEIECGEVQLEGLSTNMNSEAVRVKLENIFIPTHLTEREKNRETQDKEIGEILNKKIRLAILGKPGTGKSTLLKSIAIAYAFPDRRAQISNNLADCPYFPILIRCRDLKEKAEWPITEIINYIPQWAVIPDYSKPFIKLASDKLNEGNALLLIDGLDEITEDKSRVIFIKNLQTFLDTFSHTQIIITSREAGFDMVAGSFANYCDQYKISPLTSTEIETLSIKWHKIIVNASENTIKEAKELAHLISHNSNLRVLGGNPLLLTALFFVKRRTGNLPTNKYILYQKMIEILLLTWNIEGHEQLEIEETEAQLAYIAYWMSKSGEQTISAEDLNKCLRAARKQMPEILRYTKISVPDFIKRVELRSGLLIISGYSSIESGIITPIYEFLHLSFQEYLTSVAIVNKFLPEEDSKKTPLEILTPNLSNDSWGEIQLITAVLLKQECKELVEFLISQSKSITKQDRILIKFGISPWKKNATDKEFERITPQDIQNDDVGELTEKRFNIIYQKHLSVKLLGQYIENEIQINSELLDSALEWFAKNYISESIWSHKYSIDRILESKFGEAFRKRVKFCFFDKYEDEFAWSLTEILRSISVFHKDWVAKTQDTDTFFSSIKTEIFNLDKQTKCMGILGLTIDYSLIYPELGGIDGGSDISIDEMLEKLRKELQEIFDILLRTTPFEDPHYYIIVGYSILCVASDFGVSVASKEYTELFLDGWLNQKHNNLHLVSAFALSRILHPYVNTDLLLQHPNIRKIIQDQYQQPQFEIDKLVAMYLGIILDVKWDIGDVKTVFKEAKKNQTLYLFAEKMGLDIDAIKSEA